MVAMGTGAFQHGARLLSGVASALTGGRWPRRLTQAEFAKEYAEALRAALRGHEVTVVSPREIAVCPPGKPAMRAFTDNAYGKYLLAPSEKSALLAGYAANVAASLANAERSVDRWHIVPVVKPHDWLADAQRVLKASGHSERNDETAMIWEDLAGGLAVVYAEDLPQNVRFLREKDLEGAGVARADLRELACANLKKLLPPIERHGSDGLYMVVAGGVYESSLLLADSFWSSGQLDVRGEIVVAVPTRDVLLVTGSEHREGVRRVAETARKAFAEGSYPLVPTLLIYRGGRFIAFDSAAR